MPQQIVREIKRKKIKQDKECGEGTMDRLSVKTIHQ